MVGIQDIETGQNNRLSNVINFALKLLLLLLNTSNVATHSPHRYVVPENTRCVCSIDRHNSF